MTNLLALAPFAKHLAQHTCLFHTLGSKGKRKDVRIFGRKRQKKCLLLSLDGFPCSLFEVIRETKWMPFLSKMFQSKKPVVMTSVYPTVSCTAWATFATGCNPGNHRIFGFIDRKLDPFSLTIPNRLHLGAETLWSILSERKISVVVMNVPVTYPPECVNGVLVSGFLGVDLRKSVHPDWIYSILKHHDYRIDANTALIAKNASQEFLSDLVTTLSNRFTAFCDIITKVEWQYAHLHVMETDRLFHFFWKDIVSPELNDTEKYQKIKEFFMVLDDNIKNLFGIMKDNTEIIMLSDHGFTESLYEVQVNTILRNNGFLESDRIYETSVGTSPPVGKAYSLIPGRIFLNLKSREPKGSLSPADSECVKKDIIELFTKLKQPNSNKFLFEAVVPREIIYSGKYLTEAAELILLPANGIEPKANFNASIEVTGSAMSGAHTYNDAFLWSRSLNVVQEFPNLIDLFPSILTFFQIQGIETEGINIFE